MADISMGSNRSGSSTKEKARACAYCNKSKTKCIWPGEPGVGACTRCVRLRRQCTVPHHGERRRRGPSTRVGQLEEKIDGLVSLLNASRQIQQQSSAAEPSSSTSELQQATSAASAQDRSSASESYCILPMSCIHVNDGHLGDCAGQHAQDCLPPHHNALQTPTSTVQTSSPASEPTKSYIPPTAYVDIIPQPYGCLRITMGEAERLLKLYQTDYHPRFPFVPIPRNTTAQDLFQRAPFLFRTILQIVAPQTAALQRGFTVWFREYIATHLAVGLVVDLGLNSHKPSKHVVNGANQFVEDARRLSGFKGRPAHTLEDMRAYLGCFYVSSLAAALFRHIPVIPCSSYISFCCEKIETEAEYMEDTYLVILVRMQRIVCRILTVFPPPDSDGSGTMTFSAAAHMAMTTLRADLEDLKMQAPKHLWDNLSFDIAFKGILARLYEPVIYMTSSSVSSVDGIRKSEAMWCCLDAVKASLDVYASYPVADLSYLPFNTYCHMTFALITAARLVILQDPDWNNKLAGESLDFAGITQRLSERCDQADNVAIAEEWRRKRKYVNDTLSVMAMHRDKLRWIRSWYLSKIAAPNPAATGNNPLEPQPDSQYQGQAMPATEMIADPGNPALADALTPMSFLGDDWWQTMMDDMSFLQP
ncbi:unnamed protein product [Sordaria macrospora k-hell]|uniref:WGS project CABT00000000 data, contig 2.2 n=1 Tax=Sordaria macrospora (strain ATCC MYA-333 / DSM 997 / K(L3346) / K-hell) TaxID=771870 RepID=F7VNS2_SORMK|nr:uncharacterized protein SMAC_01025 [Sordaria macrospora k-hell]KAH7630602.1 hypothetical protein B0T09DRAFT_356839 [Sordaria sp. MPI-SDFR-AT-0083]CCC07001.1 unnamed protein product [Sordaria macrospora k-hell]